MSKSSPTDLVEIDDFHRLPIEKRAGVGVRIDSPVERPKNVRFVKDEVVGLLRFTGADEEVVERAVEHLEEVGEDPDSNVSSFVISTASVDRMDDTISVKGWQLENFLANPVVPFNHSRHAGDLSGAPVGRDIGVFKTDNALVGTTRFASKDMSDLGHSIGLMVKAGLLNATSVGFRALEYEISEERDEGQMFAPIDFTKTELLEYSIVTVPANQDCLVVARSLGIDTKPIRSWAEQLLETDSGIAVPRDTLERVATSGTKTVILPPATDQEEEKEMDLKDISADDLLAELKQRGLAPVADKAPEPEVVEEDVLSAREFEKLVEDELPNMIARELDFIETTEGSDD